MVGGMLWCIGNFLCVQVIKLIGMSMGLMIWGVINSVAGIVDFFRNSVFVDWSLGWSLGKFGLFGLKKEEVPNPNLNYVGLTFTILSLAVFAWVKTTVSKAPARSAVKVSAYTEKLLDEEESPSEFSSDWTRKVPSNLRQLIGFGLACTCGLFFGFTFGELESR